MQAASKPKQSTHHTHHTGRGHHRSGKRTIWPTLLLVVALIACLFLPTSLTIESPGPTLNVLGTVTTSVTGHLSSSNAKKTVGTDVLKISGVQRHADPGKLLMTTVNANGIPGQPALVGEALLGWLSPNAAVLPREVFFDVNQGGKQYEHGQKKEMTGAQTSAGAQAKRFLLAHGYNASSLKVDAQAGDVGGPSAGLMMTLGIIDLVTPASETGGKTIAGTGTIGKNGVVGAIGGIKFKMIGARRAGATWFLAPAANCGDVNDSIPAGLHVVRVSTLDDAYSALVKIGKGQTKNLPSCTTGSMLNV